jgi:hypothetical protein
MTSAVNKQAPQLSRKAVLTSPLRRLRPRVAKVPRGPDHIHWGKQTNMPVNTTAKRVQ